MYKHFLIAAMALTIATPCLAEEIDPPATETPSWLKSLGTFVRDGVTPPRTAAELAREEEERRQKAIREAEAHKPVLVQPVPPPAEAQPPQPEVPPPAAVEVTPAAKPAKPQPAVAAPVTPTPTPAPAPVASEAGPGPLPLPMPKARPKMVVPVIQPPPAPVPATERIAGTATLDQAIKLGGPADLYGQRIKKPKRD